MMEEMTQRRAYSVYGQWGGLVSILLLIGVGLFTFFSSEILFAMLGFGEAFLLFFLEIPFLMKVTRISV